MPKQFSNSGAYDLALSELQDVELEKLTWSRDRVWYYEIKFFLLMSLHQTEKADETLSAFSSDMEIHKDGGYRKHAMEIYRGMEKQYLDYAKENRNLILEKSREDLLFTTCSYLPSLIKEAVLGEMRAAFASVESSTFTEYLATAFIAMIAGYIEIETTIYRKKKEAISKRSEKRRRKRERTSFLFDYVGVVHRVQYQEVVSSDLAGQARPGRIRDAWVHLQIEAAGHEPRQEEVEKVSE